MSSNQGHYVGSLPNDYAILAKFSHGDEEDSLTDGEEDVNERFSSTNESERILKGARRSSFPSPYIRPQSPTIPSMSFKARIPVRHTSPADGLSASESTPLLGPLIPRIAEEYPGNDDNKKLTAMFWEELWILSKYSLPLFSFVSNVSCQLQCI
jgi:MATE family multidrug resistance protein